MRADLDAAGTGAGVLRIRCEPSGVTVALASDSGVRLVAERNGAPTVERIFQAVTELAAAVQETETAPSRAPPPAPGAPAAAPRAPARPPEAPAPPGLAVLAGPALQGWFRPAPLAPGVAAGALLARPPLSFELASGFFWNATTPDGTSARLWRAAVKLRLTVLRAPELELAGGPLLEGLSVSAGEARTPSNRDTLLFGLTLDAALVQRFSRSFFVRVGPELGLHLRDARVDLDGRELFRVPRLVPGVSMELGVSL